MQHVVKALFKKRYKVSEQRLDVCRRCDKFDLITMICDECGCNMEIKTLFPFSECPLQKWSIHIPNDPEDIVQDGRKDLDPEFYIDADNKEEFTQYIEQKEKNNE